MISTGKQNEEGGREWSQLISSDAITIRGDIKVPYLGCEFQLPDDNDDDNDDDVDKNHDDDGDEVDDDNEKMIMTMIITKILLI